MTSMTFKMASQVLPHLSVEDAILIRGPHGIGKSSLGKAFWKQLCKTEGIEYTFLDRRIGQMNEGDLMGLPDIDRAAGITRYCPPDFIKLAADRPCVLFLDEFNRANKDVQNIGFQLTLDRELSNGVKLHPKTRVLAAINTGAMYQVNRMDPALLDRFYVVDLLFDFKEFIDHATVEGVHIDMIEFLLSESQWAEPFNNPDPNKKCTSPRSVMKAARSLHHLLLESKRDMDTIRRVVSGYMGIEAGVAFTAFLRNKEQKAGNFSGAELFEDYVDIRKNLDLTRPDVLVAVVDKWYNHVKSIPVYDDMKVTERQGNNFTLILQDIPREQRTPLYQRFLAEGMERVAILKALHPYGVRLLLECYGTVPGEEGIGMLPTNPGAVIREDEEDAA